MKYFLFLFLVGCASTFDSESVAIAELERFAHENREYDKPNRAIRYLFVDDPDTYCRKVGTVARQIDNIKACAITTSDPCVIVLPYAPVKLWVVEEKLHCRYGDFHQGIK